MTKIQDLAQHILKLDPRSKLPRLAFYNFLTDFASTDFELNPNVINDFYKKALSFDYWRQHKDQLGDIVQSDLHSFFERTNVEFDPGEIRHAHDRQIIDLRGSQDFPQLIENHLEKYRPTDSKTRLIPISEKRLLAVILLPKGDLLASVFPSLATIEDGHLVPLTIVTRLHYNSYMELKLDQTQLLETGLLATAKFALSLEKVSGVSLSGHSFQKARLFSGPINQCPDIFYELKAIEKHFINLKSDPYYQEMTHLLQTAIRLVQEKHQDSAPYARNILHKGQMAMKHIFPEDKWLHVLTSQLQILCNGGPQPMSPQNESSPGNQPPGEGLIQEL